MTVAVATPEAGTVAGEIPTQSAETDSKPQDNASRETAQPDKSGRKDADKATTLKKLLEREKEDPDVRFNDEELDILDEYHDGKLKLTKAGNQPAEESKEKPEEEDPDSEPEPEKEKEGEGAEEEPEGDPEGDPEPEKGEQKPDPDAEALMKELGAKSLKEARAKLKELRNKLGGADFKANAQLRNDVTALSTAIKNERALIADVKAGKAEAIAHFEKAYGLKLAPAGGAAPAAAPAAGGVQMPADGKTFLPKELFLDDAAADQANAVIGSLFQKVQSLEGAASEFQAEKTRTRQSSAEHEARLAAVDEMVTIAQEIDGLNGVANLREAIDAWYNKGKDDPRLEPFHELFEISEQENGCSLKAALLIKRGRDSKKLIAEAEKRGRQSAFKHKPNPSLSGIQGGNGETTYTQLSERQIDAMADDHTLMPPDWFDEQDNPVQSKVPKRAWRLFGFKG